MFQSLASRLMAWHACSTFILVSAVTASLYWNLIRDFEADDDEDLHQRIEGVLSLLQQPNKSSELRWEVESEGEPFERPKMYLRVLNEQRRPILETHGMAQLIPIEAFPAAAEPDSPIHGLRVATRLGPFRAVAVKARGGGAGDHWTIQAAYDLRSEMEILHKYRYLILGILWASALLSLGIGHRIARRGLRPLAEIVETTRHIQSSSLRERVHLEHLPIELAALADNFNAMLDRLDDSFTRLSRFSADIAHEFRTPINVLRGETEVALTRNRPAEDYRSVLTSNLDEYAHLSRVVDGLLFIATAETSQMPVRREPFGVAEELKGVIDFYELIATEKRISLSVVLNEDLQLEADSVLFRRAAANLISNAITYTPRGGSISVTAAQRNGAVYLEIADSGTGIAPEHLPYVFDRFYRADRDREAASGHIGLGLSIVKTVMDLHDGAANIDSAPGAGTCVTLIFPTLRNRNL